MRLQHMLDAARRVMRFVEKRSRADLDADEMLVRAVQSAIQEIGEAAARISEDARSRVPGLPWRQIVEMRNVLVHVYWGVNRDRLWRTAIEDRTPLIAVIEESVRDWPLPPDA